MILLDADVVIDILRRHPPAIAWFDQVVEVEPITLPGFVALELIAGTRSKPDLEALEEWITDCNILWLDYVACERLIGLFSAIHLQNAVGVNDLLIAQVAMAWRLPLHTFNLKHYAAIPGLQTIQPYTR